jgi:competence protein ComEC
MQEISIFNPVYQNESNNFNDNSIVCMLEHEGSNFLLTGDISKKKEMVMVDVFDIAADVLKVGHHGSKSSTCEVFLEEVDPEISIISVGENSYGHPADEVIERLGNYSSKILRTDRDGSLVFYSREGKILFKRGLD